MKYLQYTLILLLASIPTVAFGVEPPEDFKGFVALLIGLIELLIYVIFALTFLVFVWGIIKAWIVRGGSAEGAEEGKKLLSAAIIGFVVMGALWGIVYLIKSSLFGG